MRSRDEIEKEQHELSQDFPSVISNINTRLILEVLLDIRDLLGNLGCGDGPELKTLVPENNVKGEKNGRS